MDIPGLGRAVVLVLLLALVRSLGVATEGGLVHIGSDDAAAVSDLAAFGAD